jgi:hypothetical protein
MRKFLLFALVLFFCGSALSAEETDAPRPAPAAVETTYVVRTGQRLQAPVAATYRLFEYSQQRGRWILPDMGYYDIGHFRSQLWFAGVGVEFHPSRRVTWTQIVYVAQAVGREAHNERSFWIWPVVDANLTPRLSLEAVAYPTLPLNRAQRWAFDLDRVKLEYKVNSRLVAGAGLSATTGAGMDWERRPFLTLTSSRGRAANCEFWLERIPGGAQIQVRYQLIRPGRF